MSAEAFSGSNAGEGRGTAISVALLPYACADGDLLGDDFAARITTVVHRALMEFADLKVISTGSTFRPQGTHAPNEIGRSLAARFVLEGRVECAEQVLSFSHWVNDTETGKRWLLPPAKVHISSLHDAGRSAVARIVSAIVPELRELELERVLSRGSGHRGAQDLFLRALLAIERLTRDSLDQAEALLVEAQSRDRFFASAFAWHARVCSLRVGQGWTEDAGATAQKASLLANKAIELDPANAVGLAVAGHMRSYLFGDCEGGLALCDRAIAACPNEPQAWIMSGLTLAYLGNPIEGLRRVRYGMSLAPLDRLSFLHQSSAATCAYCAADYEETLRFARAALSENPSYSATVRLMACALAGLGMICEARRYGAQLRRIQPDFAEHCERLILYKDPLVRERTFKHLQIAGVLATTQYA